MSSSESSTDASTDATTNSSAETSPEEKQAVTVDNKPEKTSKKKPVASKQEAGRKSSVFSVILILFTLILLAAIGGGYYYWQQLQQTLLGFEQTSLQQVNEIASLSAKVKDSDIQLQQYATNLATLSTNFEEQTKQLEFLNQAQQSLIKSTANIFDITHRNQRKWLLAEVSYLLSLANQRLLISRDINTAIAALKSANNRLHDLSDPALLVLRKKIADEISALNQISQPDINGIAFTLDNVIPLISQLPFKTAKQKTIESAQTSETIELPSLDNQSFIAPLWARIKSLVSIKRHNRELQQSETPLEKNNIDNQLRYRIEASRLSLLNKNSTVFNYELQTTVELLSLYYDDTDNRVASLLTELTPYTKINLLPDLPDITGSWVMLQKIIAVNDAQDSLQPADNNEKKGTSIK